MSGDDNSRERRVDQVIASYLKAVDAGVAPGPLEVIANHPDVASELAEFFVNREQFAQLAEPLQSDLTGALPQPESEFHSTTRSNIQNGPGSRSFGDYELLDEIARGGMGVVYKARQTSLKRIVAVKMILAGRLAAPDDVQRFRAEAEAAASLDHPGIVPIYEVGEIDGQHFFSMAYVDGTSLAVQLRDGPMAARTAAQWLSQICEAVQMAHEHGVVHRDLKPANILLELKDTTDDLTGDAIRVRITDFGLAKRLQSDLNLTGTGQILGTPNYMSPEQASGAATPIGPAADIYSLGAILYHMLTGRPPFQADTALETISQLVDTEPLPPRLLNRNLPRDLEAICMKCLCKDPRRRYASAEDLERDLKCFLNGEVIQASGVNLLDRVSDAIRSSRNEEHFRGWGTALIAFGMVILASHVAIFVLERTWYDSWSNYVLTRSAMFGMLLIMLWRFRHHSILPTKTAERIVWAVWIAYLCGLAAINASREILGHEQRESYSAFAVLAGFGFLVMGAHMWGGGYVVGIVFMAASLTMAKSTELAPLIFGVLWAGALTAFGIHFWGQGRRRETSPEALLDKNRPR